VFTGLADERGQLVGCVDGADLVSRRDARQPQDGVGRRGDRGEQGPGGAGEGPQRRDEPQRGPFRACQGQVLRHHLAEDDVAGDDQREGEGEGDRLGQALR
jgi:hypothetical protein